MNNILWYIGCSGFYYKEWKGIFYPKEIPQREWFEYYCRHFNTLEINNTFYRFPELKSLQGWFNRSPENFMFTVKAPRIITHQKKFKETESVTKEFYQIAGEGLGQKLGCVLFQLPPSAHFSEELLHAIIAQLDKGYHNVIEFRHNSWWQPKVYQALAEAHITFCSASFPALPDDVINNTPTTYYRFHGVPKLYYSPYNNDFLSHIAKNILAKNDCKKAFLYFNNTASAAALDNARFVQHLVK